MFLLVRELTGSAAAALVAGALFTCTAFRFEHYVHLERAVSSSGFEQYTQCSGQRCVISAISASGWKH